ncbi:MAG TPA: aminoacyl-tRNA deacylase [Spirochaetia bacterium]|nr:aminoacyl-tRNA deacylase [Spirochaetia bacterium]
MRTVKTNAIRLLRARNESFELYTYDASDGRIDAQAVAEKIGVQPELLFKTLVTRASGGRSAGNIVIFCIQGTRELDIDRAASASGASSVSLVATEELLPLTGYVRGGCSPFGMKRHYPLYLDHSANALDRIVVSGGRIGVQLGVAPSALVDLAGARFAALV